MPTSTDAFALFQHLIWVTHFPSKSHSEGAFSKKASRSARLNLHRFPMIFPLISPRFTYSLTVLVLSRSASAASESVRNLSPSEEDSILPCFVIAAFLSAASVRATSGILRRTSAGESSCNRLRHSTRHSATNGRRPVRSERLRGSRASPHERGPATYRPERASASNRGCLL